MNSKLDKTIFWPSILLVVIATFLLVIFRETAGPVLEGMLTGITYRLDWAFEFLTIGLFIILVWLMVGRYGRVKLGGIDDKPEFSRFSWGGMLFCASMGTSIMFWSIVEPLYYYTGPPFGIEGGSAEAAEYAVSYGLFHWGISAWALYALPAVVMAYSFYVRKDPSLKISAACRGVLGKHADGFIGKVIDILVIWSMIGGLGTSLGLGVPMVSTVIGDILNIEPTLTLNLIIIVIWTFIFSASAYMGLYKGIRKLSDWNVYMALGLAVFVIIVGPTLFILSYFTNSLGLMIDNFARMSLYTDPINQSGFPQAWTVFYWAWFAATAPFIGIFVARISKGRSIRELVFNVLMWGTLGSWLYFGVFGGYAMNLELTGEVPLVDILTGESEQAVIVAVLNSLPMPLLVSIFFVILGFIFLATSLDSASYVIASVATKELHGNAEPARWHRLLWGIVLSALAISLTLAGGLNVVQTSSVLVSVPILIMYVLLAASLIKWLQADTDRHIYVDHRE
ncbi:BCCT family transporter [Bacillus thermotolerans]|uniref:High-affinity choline uptake protein BetT n=1 Tax=Bacillus thermotolerans TaxID=1221996 RepID=A0A0F5I6L5_BACTR|nr:BCCT family transporter [Bacillus thermotolerans]KKB40935.1 High-affinity choline uptake protein BetT [Bacillus thermotolerans]KKB44997.1 High-affinity choline uptake protein BetT [Bacillus thermotolerans]